jgi:hypothetical protein
MEDERLNGTYNPPFIVRYHCPFPLEARKLVQRLIIFRTRIYDILRGKKDWLVTHDGRAIINSTLMDHDSGTPEVELQQKYDTALKEGDYSRLVVYAGTAIGLIVKKEQTVEEILDEVETQFAQQVRLVNQKLNNL